MLTVPWLTWEIILIDRMFLENYEKLQQHYIEGCSQVQYRSFRPSGSKNDNHWKSVHGNYNLFFNDSGLLLKSHHFDRQSETVLYHYDQGQLESMDFLFRNRVSRRTLIYYDVNRPTREVNCNPGGEYYYVDYEYSKDMTRTILYDTFSEDISIFDSKYEDDLLVEKKAQTRHGQLYYWDKIKYNDRGKMITEYSHDGFGEVDGFTNFLYNGVLEKGYDMFDRNGNLEFEERYDYELDGSGNWTKKVLIGNGKTKLMYTRSMS